jgi:MFS family permease
MPRAHEARALQRARAAVSVLFLVNAVLYANLVPRLPEVKDALGLSNASLGAALASMPAGALLAGLFAPVVISRFGSARVASTGLIGMCAALVGVPLAGSWVGFAAALFALGALDSVVDVAQNAHGFRVQRRYARSIVNAFHGLWSAGAVLGGLMGSVAAGFAVPLGWHLTATAAFFGSLALLSWRFLLPGPEDTERATTAGGPDREVFAGDRDPDAAAEPDPTPPPTQRDAAVAVSRHTVLLLAALGVLAMAGSFVEDAGASWGALYLRNEVGAGAALAGAAFVALQGAMTVGRLTGDRFVDRYGQRRVARVGGGLIAAGIALTLALPSVYTAVVGFGAAGLGVATLVPAVMHTADEIPGLRHGVGLTVVSWLLRVGFLVSPPLIGVLADLRSLRAALVVVVAAGVTIAVLGRVLNGHDRAS